MKPSCKKLLEAMQRGEEISVKTSIIRHGISACGQRMTELRAAGIPVQDRWAAAPNGAKYKIYFLPADRQTGGRRPQETVVRAHVSRLSNDIDAEPVDIQKNLFG